MRVCCFLASEYWILDYTLSALYTSRVNPRSDGGQSRQRAVASIWKKVFGISIYPTLLLSISALFPPIAVVCRHSLFFINFHHTFSSGGRGYLRPSRKSLEVVENSLKLHFQNIFCLTIRLMIYVSHRITNTTFRLLQIQNTNSTFFPRIQRHW